MYNGEKTPAVLFYKSKQNLSFNKDRTNLIEKNGRQKMYFKDPLDFFNIEAN